jgi:hypothetical protein
MRLLSWVMCAVDQGSADDTHSKAAYRCLLGSSYSYCSAPHQDGDAEQHGRRGDGVEDGAGHVEEKADTGPGVMPILGGKHSFRGRIEGA